MNVEHGTFTPLVFSVNGGMAKECLKFHKFVAERSQISLVVAMKKFFQQSNANFHFSFLVLL